MIFFSRLWPMFRCFCCWFQGGLTVNSSLGFEFKRFSFRWHEKYEMGSSLKQTDETGCYQARLVVNLFVVSCSTMFQLGIPEILNHQSNYQQRQLKDLLRFKVFLVQCVKRYSSSRYIKGIP